MTVIILLDTCAVVDFVFGAILDADIKNSRRQHQGPFLYNRNLRISKRYLDWYKCCRAWLEGRSRRWKDIEIGITRTVYDEASDNYKVQRIGGFLENFLTSIRKGNIIHRRDIKEALVAKYYEFFNRYFPPDRIMQTHVLNVNGIHLNTVLDYMRQMRGVLRDPNPPQMDRMILTECFSIARERNNTYSSIEIYSSDRYHFLFIGNLLSNEDLRLPDYFSKIEISNHRNNDISQYAC